MVKKLKRLVLAWCVLFIAGMSLSGAQTFAKAKSFKRSETEMSSCLHNTPMNLDKNDNINYYQIEEKVDKQEKYYWQIKKFLHKDNQENNTQNIAGYGDYVKFVKGNKKDSQTVVTTIIKRGKLCFTVFDKKGKKISEAIDKFTKKENYNYNMEINDISVNGNKLYYAYIKNGEQAHIRCINMKSGKLISDNLLKSKDDTKDMKIYKNQIYVLGSKAVKTYSFAGKKMSTHKLPKVKNIIFDDFDISGNYIYYSNGQDGIYRCNVNKTKGFSLYYNAKGDTCYQQCKVFDICVANEDTFYVMYVEKNNNDLFYPTKIAEYTR